MNRSYYQNLIKNIKGEFKTLNSGSDRRVLFNPNEPNLVIKHEFMNGSNQNAVELYLIDELTKHGYESICPKVYYTEGDYIVFKRYNELGTLANMLVEHDEQIFYRRSLYNRYGTTLFTDLFPQFEGKEEAEVFNPELLDLIMARDYGVVRLEAYNKFIKTVQDILVDPKLKHLNIDYFSDLSLVNLGVDEHGDIIMIDLGNIYTKESL